MYCSTILLPLSLALAVAADPLAASITIPGGLSVARQFRRDTPDVDPAALCGKDYKDCGDGWCCGSTQECSGKLSNGIPACKDPSMTIAPTAGATPYKDIDAKVSSMLALKTATQGTNSKASNAANPANKLGMKWAVAAGGAGLFFL